MKPFLIIAGAISSPRWKTEDWNKTYKTLEEAENQVKEITNRFIKYEINGHTYDWYTIVDLREWIYGS